MSLSKKHCMTVVAVVFIGFALVGATLGSALWHWATAPLSFARAPLDFTIKPGMSLKSVVHELKRNGVPVQPLLFEGLARVLGVSAQLKAGNYALPEGISPYSLLQKIVMGDVHQYALKVVEGWTFSQMRAAIDQSPTLTHQTALWSDAQLLREIDAAQIHPEGLFFPDTYFFDEASSDLALYKRAYRLGQQRLEQAWGRRALDLPYQTSYQALIMASLIEKETGQEQDRPFVSAVFANRLRVGMPLQTDPSVIYGLAKSYTGDLTRKNLRMDTAYNTYTRRGLPPTPIALPGMASLEAAMHPANSPALYFVSRGDGSSEFSKTLSEHNRAVDKFIRKSP